MANASPCHSMALVSLESPEQRGAYVADTNVDLPQPSLSRQIRNDHPDGPLAILWDIENCPIPSDVRPEDVAGNIRMALRVHPVIKGAVMTFSAFGDFNAFPRRLREGCQRTGIKLVDVPNGRKDAADKAILVDMFLFALDNPPPSSIMLISGDVDFSPALHILGQRGYTIILVIPSGVGVSSALCNAGKFVWDWPSVARGEGFVPPKALIPHRSIPNDFAGFISGYGSYPINENPIGQIQNGQNQNEEEAIAYRGMSQSFGNSGDYSLVSQSITEYSSSCMGLSYYPSTARSHSLPQGLNEASNADQNDSSMLWVQPGDFNGLKMQLVKLLELSGGCLPLIRVPAEYQKLFGRPLYISEYGSVKLVNLFKRMGDVLSVDAKGQRKFVYLKNWRANPTQNNSPPSVVPPRNDYNQNNSIKKGKGIQEESSDEFSDEEQRGLVDEEQRNSTERKVDDDTEQRLFQFKFELQEILVSYSCRIFLSYFEDIYEQRYKRRLDFRSLGVGGLEELFGKMRAVVTLSEEPLNKRKFIAAVEG